MAAKHAFDTRARPLTKDEVQACRALLATDDVTRAWLVRINGPALEILEPPKLSRTEMRRGAAADFTRWQPHDGTPLLDPAGYRAAVSKSGIYR